jgi:hypothetical protein
MNTGSARAIVVDGDEVVVVIGYLPGPAETPCAVDARAAYLGDGGFLVSSPVIED